MACRERGFYFLMSFLSDTDARHRKQKRNRVIYDNLDYNWETRYVFATEPPRGVWAWYFLLRDGCTCTEVNSS